MDSFQKSLVWFVLLGIPPLSDKLYRHGSAVRWPCLRCTQNDETVLHALIQHQEIADL